MSDALKAIRGMNDLLPEQNAYWQLLENALRHLADSFGYDEIRTPVLEPTGLFARTLGDNTDVVEKEMYTFTDRNGESLSLRPEGTASCVRAAIEHHLINRGQTQKLWYMGPMYRHERPQKGRYRQFYQFGLEAFGYKGPDIDVELILMLEKLWQQLNCRHDIVLEINTLGTSAERKHYRDALVNYFNQHNNVLDDDSRRRLTTNPLRILDSKNPNMQEMIHNAPILKDYLTDSSLSHYEQFCHYLESLKISYEFNPHLVRGLDYYNHVVFEWVTNKLGAQGTVCAGGRYDGLVGLLGGQDCPGVGLALGLERVLALMQHAPPKLLAKQKIIFITTPEQAAKEKAFMLADHCRDKYPNVQVMVTPGDSSIKAQFKRADKLNADIAVIIGDEELTNGNVTIKYLKQDKPQRVASQKNWLTQLVL